MKCAIESTIEEKTEETTSQIFKDGDFIGHGILDAQIGTKSCSALAAFPPLSLRAPMLKCGDTTHHNDCHSHQRCDEPIV